MFHKFCLVAWFTFDPALSHTPNSGLVFTNNNLTVSVDGWEHRVVLGSVGFSRGIHYWEFTIDTYTADTDPAFGIARIDVARDQMLGKFNFAFAKIYLFFFFNENITDFWSFWICLFKTIRQR